MSDTPSKPRVYVNALFCDTVIKESESNLLTAVRITDGYTINPLAVPPRLPDGTLDHEHPLMVFQPLRLSAVFNFRTEQPSEFSFVIKGTRPSGKPLSSSTPTPVMMRTGAGAEGNILNVSFTMSTDEPGDYWFEFWIDDEIATKVPIRIIHGAAAVALGPESELASPPVPAKNPGK
ncbi:hypothetical protein SBA3_3410004 [Candidatus Sulfopaludibacter sp. SbA3]|nr:hypothetical protein SBA3_3410004 [Candidatus Sulfopaludibacter sp. SbA3]